MAQVERQLDEQIKLRNNNVKMLSDLEKNCTYKKQGATVSRHILTDAGTRDEKAQSMRCK